MKTIDLYITRLCNLNCEYCYVDLEKREEWFELQKFTERVNLLDYDHIKFFGWEPLLKWKEIQEIVKMLEWKDKKFSIVTNGLLLDKKKLVFCLQNQVEIVISMHFKSIKQILPKVQDFVFANKILGFSFIFEDIRLQYPYKIILYLEKIGFTNFILTPEVYGNWNEKNLQKLEWELEKFFEMKIQNPKLKFTGPSATNLIKLIKWCTKFIYTKEWERKICNRFNSLKNLQKWVIIDVYKKFNEVIDYDNNPDKWFYVCPIWWYFDTLSLGGNYEQRILEYKNLNEVFLRFYRKINNLSGKINFLTEKIDEIRFNLTSQCNIRCEYCYVDFKNDKLDFSLAKNIVDYLVLKEWNEKIISFFGGEPMLEFENLKNIVEYAKKKFEEKNKQISFKVATNFLLMNEEKMDFLRENNFEIHISMNGNVENNNKMRDNSTERLLKNFEKFLSSEERKNIVILLAFSNFEIKNLRENIEFILNLWFQKINLEMIFGKKYNWQKTDFLALQEEFVKIKNSEIFQNLEIYNHFREKNILDISPKWECNDNSLDFHNYEADFKKQKIFKFILKKYFHENTFK